MELSEREREIAERIREESTGDIIQIDVDEHGFLVIRTTPEVPEPHLYRVNLEVHPDGSESLHWKLLEPVDQPDTGGKDN